jgi:nuclear transport factor 2 (NTF2) superfamily protein
MKILKYILSMAVLLLVLVSCEEDIDPGSVNTKQLSGEWFVNYSTEGYESGYTQLLTFNTASDNGEEIWISDEGNFWVYKVKCPVNIQDFTFSGEDLVSVAFWNDELYDIEIDIMNGKIIKDASLQPSGVRADSIYFEIEFEDDPGTIYQAAGFRRTGFLEDEH